MAPPLPGVRNLCSHFTQSLSLQILQVYSVRTRKLVHVLQRSYSTTLPQFPLSCPCVARGPHNPSLSKRLCTSHFKQTPLASLAVTIPHLTQGPFRYPLCSLSTQLSPYLQIKHKPSVVMGLAELLHFTQIL
jgi:hypothetical protein